jgi:hypothetical protein
VRRGLLAHRHQLQHHGRRGGQRHAELPIESLRSLFALLTRAGLLVALSRFSVSRRVMS